MEHKKKALTAASIACLALCGPFVAREEGLRTKAYLDSVGIPTICYGETENVQLGDQFTAAECSAMLYGKLGTFAYAVDVSVGPPMKPEFHAALTSWSYNVGLGAMRKSTLIKKANAGDFRGACDELLRWKFAGGKPILQKRRERERALCLQGI